MRTRPGLPVFASVVAIALAALGGCQREGKQEAEPPSTVATTTPAPTSVPPGTVPPGPPLCDLLSADEASAALRFDVTTAAPATSLTCVYTSRSPGHVGTVLALSASDSGDDLEALIAAARSGASAFEEIDGVGERAYVAVVDGRHQAALVARPRQYSLSLVAAPQALDPTAAKKSLVKMLKVMGSHL